METPALSVQASTSILMASTATDVKRQCEDVPNAPVVLNAKLVDLDTTRFLPQDVNFAVPLLTTAMSARIPRPAPNARTFRTSLQGSANLAEQPFRNATHV